MKFGGEIEEGRLSPFSFDLSSEVLVDLLDLVDDIVIVDKVLHQNPGLHRSLLPAAIPNSRVSAICNHRNQGTYQGSCLLE